ncbi:MAG: cell wall-binding repeat-containing protein [Actinomycetota bacterium]|nr:cell wall-binding repeat-containing protein [Actinomycetota bacterium]
MLIAGVATILCIASFAPFFFIPHAISASGGHTVTFNVVAPPDEGGGGGVLPYTEKVERVFGPDRYRTAATVSQKGWPKGSTYVIVSTGENFPDGLAGSALAGAYGCPILLTETGALNSYAKGEINRLKATGCFILGETGAVSDSVRAQIIAQTGADNITRLGGIDRYETAEIIAGAVKAKTSRVGKVIIASGEDFPDALAVSPLAGYKGFPILLVKKDSVPASTQSAIKSLGATSAIVVGGNGVVSDAAFSSLVIGSPGYGIAGRIVSQATKERLEDMKTAALRLLGITTAKPSSNMAAAAFTSATRLAGADRYETAVAVAEHSKSIYGLSYNTTLAATGVLFPDALTGGAYGAQVGSVMILVHPADLTASKPTKDFLAANRGAISKVVILGGPGAVSEAVLGQIDALI